MDKSVKEAKEVFAAWLALPRKLRKPRTKRELAEKLGVNPVQLTRWSKDPEVWKLVDRHHIARLRDYLGDIMQAAVQHAVDGNHNYAKMIIDVVRNSLERQEKIVVHQDVRHLSDEEIVEKMFAMLQRKGEVPVSRENFVKMMTGGSGKPPVARA